MDQVKDWLRTKTNSLRPGDPGGEHTHCATHVYNVVVTPSNIPEFTIPRSLDSIESLSAISRGSISEGSPSDQRGGGGGGGSGCGGANSQSSSVHTSPRNSPSPRGSNCYLFPVSPGGFGRDRSKSAPVSPERRKSDNDVDQGKVSVGLLLPGDALLLRQTGSSCGAVDDLASSKTNADPMSEAAMELRHFQTKTSFGFDTLTQAPHTRRKESLFHDIGLTRSLSVNRSRMSGIKSAFRQSTTDGSGAGSGDISPASSEGLSPSLSRERSSCRKRRKIPSVVVPLGVIPIRQRQSLDDSCSDASPTSPTEHNTPTRINGAYHLGVDSDDTITPGSTDEAFWHHRSFRYFRRRSSVVLGGNDTDETLPDVRYFEAGIKCRSHETLTRHRSLNMPLSNQTNPLSGFNRGSSLHYSYTSRSATSSPAASRSNSNKHSSILQRGNSLESSVIDKTRSVDCSELSLLENRLLANLGELKFSIRFLSESKRLKVFVIKAENLGGSQKSPEGVSAFIKLYLMPNKLQKQTSKVVKHTHNPSFNQEFYFSGLTLDEIKMSRLCMKLFHRVKSLKREELLGEVQVDLAQLDLMEETRMWNHLQTHVKNEQLGYLEVKACFEAKEELLSISVIRARDLPKHTITGSPDAYVKVSVTQSSRPKAKHQTKVQKRNVSPTFYEHFTFKISPRIEDLNFAAVTLTVMSHAHLCGDDVIGQVRLGYGATEDSEFQHWNRVLQNPGKSLVKWHSIMEMED